MTETNVTNLPAPKRSIISALAERYGMEAKPFESMMRAVALPKDASNEEFSACLMVAHEHHLNPITREIYFMRTKSGTIQPIVGVDGWVRKANEHPKFDGMEFDDTVDEKGNLVSVTARIFRKDRTRPTVVTEYMSECRGQSPAWKQTPSRMLRHRAMIQCARYAFGFAGIMDQDEFEQWQHDKREPRDITPRLEVPPVPPVPDPPPPPPDEAANRAGFLQDLETELAAAIDADAIGEIWIRRRDLATHIGCGEDAEALFAKREEELAE